MDRKTFLENKLQLLKRDNPQSLGSLAEPLSKFTESNKPFKIQADGNWFQVNFDAVQIRDDRAVISARRISNGLVACGYDDELKEFKIEFHGTRAAYLMGYYKPSHPIGLWPYIYWDVRSYANNPLNQNMRVYVSDFRAHTELRRLINEMQGYYGTRNIVNEYINDNLTRFQLGIRAGKTVDEIEKSWSRGLMESLGYNFVEAEGHPNKAWQNVYVHWYKMKKDRIYNEA